MNLVLLRESDRIGDGRYRVIDQRLTHIIDVLGLSARDSLAIGLLNGGSGIGEVERLTDTEAIIRVLHLHEIPAPPLDTDLLLAIPRPKTLRKILVTCGMMGVRSLHLIRANRTEKSYLLSPLLQLEEYEPYLLDGLSQGKITRLPEVHLHKLFRPFVEDTLPTLPGYSSAAKLLSDLLPSGRLYEILPGQIPGNAMLAIGPEGGWVPFERELLQRAGFIAFNLGPWVLRVETAVAVALGQLELLRHQRSSGFPPARE